MSAAIALVVLGSFAAWELSPDRRRDGKPVTGVYDFPRDSVFHHRNTCSRAAEDTDGGR